MDSEDGQVFVKNLASFVRTHERALANALQLQRQQRVKNGSKDPSPTSSSGSGSAAAATSISLSTSKPFFSLKTQQIKAAKLSLTPHHLYYLLSKFEDLGVDVGPMKIRLEDIHNNAVPEYMSFLGSGPKSKGKPTDTDSLKSVSSVRSVMSTVSSLWTNLSLAHSQAKAEKQLAQLRDDVKYLYSCFTKIPALRLSPDNNARLISGYEMQPFDTAVPLFAFKNLSSLEICDLDFRQFHGWDKLSENLRSLTVKRANLEDPTDILLNIVLDDMVGRRTRASKQVPTAPSTPHLMPWPSNSPRMKQAEMARSLTAPDSPLAEQTLLGSPRRRIRRGMSVDESKIFSTPVRKRSNSPTRPASSRQGSLQKHRRSGGAQVYRRSSGSSGSSTHDTTPRHSTSDLLSMGLLPVIQWNCLRHLSLAENGLTAIYPTSLNPVAETLQSLDLSGNLFTEVPDVSNLTHLRALNLSNCMIDGLQSLLHTPMPAVTTVNLRANRLRRLVGIEKLPSLERVDLRDNKLADPQEIARLTGLPNIRDIYVAKNPFTKDFGNFRITIFNLFRRTPGYTEDITIDSFGPLYNEKKSLVDRVPELANVPVIKPPAEDEDEVSPEPSPTVEPVETDVIKPLFETQELPIPIKPIHRRTTSDFGPNSTRRRKKAPRRRIVELTQQSLTTPSPPNNQQARDQLPPLTPSESLEPATPDSAMYHTAPTTLLPTRTTPTRPGLASAFTTPTPAPRIRLSSDDEDEDSPELVSNAKMNLSSDLYRKKMETLKHDMGAEWLTALRGGTEKAAAAQRRPGERKTSFSPDPRTEAARRQQAARGISIGGRALG